MKLLTRFVLSTLPLIIRMAPLILMTLFGGANTFDVATVTYGIKRILFHVRRCLAILHAESHSKYLVFLQQNILGDMLRQLNMINNEISVMMYLRNRLFYILQPVRPSVLQAQKPLS